MARKAWVAHNNDVFKKGVEQYKQLLESKMRKVFNALAVDVVDYIETFSEIEGMPFFTGNLADGTGVGVYMNGQLMAYMPARKASEPQDYKGITNIWGTEYLFDALNAAESQYSKGIWVVLFSTVPYAVEVNEEGTSHTDIGFFSETMKTEMLEKFKTAFAQEFPNIATQLNI